jgi:hypothetical protein
MEVANVKIAGLARDIGAKGARVKLCFLSSCKIIISIINYMPNCTAPFLAF